ncbi:hypothetical protein DZB15_08075 [Klebsiella pneumoniae]|nr:hypothetical protein DZB15_08075 [Klebsiella pneumoniae]
MRAILLAILNLGRARHPHVLHVGSGFCALSAFKLPAPITPAGIDSKYHLKMIYLRRRFNKS